MRNAAAAVTTVDAYLAALPPAQRAALEHLRQVILSAAPGAVEARPSATSQRPAST